MYLLDTDTLTHLHAGHRGIVQHLTGLRDPSVGTTVVTKIELLRGRFEFLLKAANGAEVARAQHWLTRTEQLLAELMVIPFDADSAQHFDRLLSLPQVRKIGRADLLIGSIALAHRATLVTRNVRHFRAIPGLAIENWID